MEGTALKSLLSARTSWLQARHAVLSQNVANADTPDFAPRDIAEPDFERLATRAAQPSPALPMARTSSAHLVGSASSSILAAGREIDGFEIAPAGNEVILEEQAQLLQLTQLDYQLSTGIYSKIVGLMRTAIGTGGA